MTALLYPGCLPPGALVRVDPLATPPPPRPAPIWLTADPADLDPVPTDAARATGWHAYGAPEIVARAVPANPAGTAFAGGALRLEAEVNGGLVVKDVLADAACLTLGLILRAGLPEARTLLTLQPLGAEGSLFLDARGEVLRLAQKGGDTQLTLQAQGAGDQVTLVLVGLAEGQAWLAANAGAPVQGRFGLVTSGPADLFIACRGARAGLRNKLGSFALSDVMIWPGQNLLAEAQDVALNGAIGLWQERARRGL